MPQVPVYNQGQVQEQALPNARFQANAPLDAFGGGESAAGANRAMQGVFNEVTKIQQEEKKKADDLATTEAYVKINQAKTRLFFDPKSGAMNARGKDAFAQIDTVGASFDKEADDIYNSLSNVEQKQIFERMRLKERGELDEHLQKHAFQEARKYDDEVTRSGLESAMNDAVLNYNDPEKVQNSIGLQKSLIQAHAQRNGLPPKAVEMLLLEQESKTHVGIIKQMLVGRDDISAKKYYEELKKSPGTLSAQDELTVRGLVKEGSTRGEAQRQATQIMGENGKDMRAALDAARLIEDPDVQQMTVSEIKTRFAENENIKNTQQKKFFEGVVNDIYKTKQFPNANTMYALDYQEKKAVESLFESIRSGQKIQTDWDEYYKLKQMAADPDTRQQFLGRNLLLYKPILGDTEWKEMVNIQTSMEKGDNKEIDGYRTKAGIIDGVLAENGYKKGDKKSNMFRREMEDQIRAFKDQYGKEPKNEDVQRMADGLMIKATEGIIFGFGSKRRFEMDPNKPEEIKISVKDIPRNDRRDIEAALKRKNKPVTEDMIVDVYKRGLVTKAK